MFCAQPCSLASAAWRQAVKLVLAHKNLKKGHTLSCFLQNDVQLVIVATFFGFLTIFSELLWFVFFPLMVRGINWPELVIAHLCAVAAIIVYNYIIICWSV